MRIYDLDDEDIKEKLKITDLENAFDIFVDKKLNNMFNLNKSIYINVDLESLPKFQCTHTMHWTLISYKIYNTTRLAWLLWKVNKVKMEDTFKAKQPGDVVRYLPKDYVQAIVADLVEFNR